MEECVMSYVTKKGAGAIESATTEKQDFSKAIKSLKSGTAFKVRVPSAEEVVEVFIHSVYEVFYSTPCTRDDLYDKAVELLYADAKKANEAGDEKGAEALRRHAYALKAKPRYLFGFINLEDGEPMIIDLSKKQAQGVIATIKKYEKRLDQLAFEISKTGKGQSTTVGFNPLMFLEEDLTPQELKHFNESAGKAIDDEVYENCLYVKKPAEQAEDIIAYERKNKGLNLAERLGLDDIANAGEPEDVLQEIDEQEERNYGF